MPPRTGSDVVAPVVAVTALLAQVFEIAFDLDDLTDPDDVDVFADQIECAGRHMAEAIWCLHPRWRDLDRRAAEHEALDLFRTYRPDIDDSLRGRKATLDLLNAAAGATVGGIRAARRYRRERRFRDVAAELDYTREHIENALYLLDPEGFLADVDATTPEQRVMLASRIEVIELELEENRRVLREGRRLLCVSPWEPSASPERRS